MRCSRLCYISLFCLLPRARCQNFYDIKTRFNKLNQESIISYHIILSCYKRILCYFEMSYHIIKWILFHAKMNKYLKRNSTPYQTWNVSLSWASTLARHRRRSQKMTKTTTNDKTSISNAITASFDEQDVSLIPSTSPIQSKKVQNSLLWSLTSQ